MLTSTGGCGLVSGSPLPSVDKSNFPKWNQVAEKASDDDQQLRYRYSTKYDYKIPSMPISVSKLPMTNTVVRKKRTKSRANGDLPGSH